VHDGNCERVAGENHEGNQPSDCPLAVRIGADELRNVPDRCRLGLNPAALGGHGGALSFEGGQGQPSKRPASVIIMRANWTFRLPTFMVWRCAVASPSWTRPASISTLNAWASNVAPVQPRSPAAASISSAQRCSPLR